MPSEPATTTAFDAKSPSLLRLISNLNTPWKMRLYFLRKLPSCLFWGVRVQSCTPDEGKVSIPYSRRTQNPFRSIYFAALAGAAELSTGLLAIIALHGRGRISMLITNIEAEFTKKADTRTTFTCTEGKAIRESVQRAIDTGEGQTIRVLSTGRNASGEEVCKVWLTWSFKVKGASFFTE